MSFPVYDPEVYGEPVYNDALIDPDVYGEVPYAEEGATTVEDSFTVDAIILRTVSGPPLLFTVDAYFPGGAFEVDEDFTADAVLLRTISGSFTVDAAILRTISGSLTADAVVRRTSSTAIAADAVLIKAISATFTANAVMSKTQASSKTADAILRVGRSGSLTADSVILPHFTINAVTKRTYTKAFLVDARLLAHSFTARAVIVAVAPPPGTKIAAVIRVNDVDITRDVMIKGATFTQAVSARPGQFKFEVKDDEHVYQFISGGRVTLDINGRRAFDGYVNRATMRYAFEVDEVANPATTPRIWLLEGPDLNILLQKRMVFDQVNPNGELPTYAAGTSDRTIILDFINDYIDLDGDDITTDGVTAVGSPNPDADGYVISTGSTWAAAMASIAQLPGAVWGLTQDRDLFYEDDSTESAPFQLSDTPNGTTTFGYSNFTWTDDGTRMVNDAQVWGAGTGSTTGAPTYSRTTDATSVTAHGRWQQPGNFRSDMYKQATVDNAADSIVYGSVQNLHGGKDPYVLVNCRIKKQGLRAGMKVRFINSVFNLDKVLPIRRLTITFVNLYDVLYDLELTQEIDEPWFFAEFAGYPIVNRRWKPPKHKKLVWPPPPEPGECDCGFTDTFTRTQALVNGPPGWGRSDAGTEWLAYEGTGLLSVTDGHGVMRAEWDTENFFAFTETILPSMDLDFRVGLKVRFPDSGTGDSGSAVFFELDGPWVTNPSPTRKWRNWAYIGWDGQGDAFFQIGAVHGIYTNQVYGTQIPFAIDPLAWYQFKAEQDYGVEYRAKLWEVGTAEPATWTATVDLSSQESPTDGSLLAACWFYTQLYAADDIDREVWYDDLDLPWVTRCTAVQFDDFNRTVSSGWGVATPSGYAWTQSIGTGSSVDGSYGLLTHPGTAGAQSQQMGAFGGPWIEPISDCLVRFKTPTAIPTSPYSRLKVQFRDSGTRDGGAVTLEISSTTGEIGLTDNFVAKTDWVADTWYQLLIHADHVAHTVNATVWVDGTTQPGTPDVSGDIDPLYVLDSLAEMNVIWRKDTAAGVARTVAIDSIDFDYDGKPCYDSGCGGTTLITADEFARTAAPSQTMGTSEFTGSPVWQHYGAPGGGLTATTMNGSAAVSTSGTFPNNGTLNKVTINVPVPIELVSRFRTHSAQASTLCQYRWNLTNAANTHQMYLSVNAEQPGFGGGFFAVGYYDGAYGEVLQDFTDIGFVAAEDTWINVRASFGQNGLLRVRVWHDGDAEPSFWMRSLVVPVAVISELNNDNILYVAMTASNGLTSSTMEMEYIRFYDPCDGLVLAGSGLPQTVTAGAYGCQTATRLTATSYELWYTPIAGTTSVYLNGRLMRPGYDYDEGLLTRTIEFTLSVNENDVVYVCYQAGGIHDNPGPWTSGV